MNLVKNLIKPLAQFKSILVVVLLSSYAANAQRVGLGVGAKPAAPVANMGIDPANPKEYTIAEVTVSGTQFLDPNSMISISGLKPGDKIRIPGPAVTSSLKKMMDFGTLDDVEILATKVEGEKVWLNIHIKERPRLYKVSFSGVRKGERETLNDKVKLIKGRVITPTVIKNTQLVIKKYYMDKGFYNIKVKVVQIPDSTRGQATLNFGITKGKKVKIQKINIEGNKAVSDRTLKRKMKGTKQKMLGRLFNPSKYIPKKYDEDKEKLIAYYRKSGYRDATIEFDSIKNNGETISINMKIDEGIKYYYRNISWSGNYLYTSRYLGDRLGVKKGDVYNPEELDKKINGIPGNDISSIYMDDGYLYFRAVPTEKAVEGDSIDVEVRMFEGKQATINRILLNGNTKTSDRVVLRELFTLPGQKFSKTEIINTQRQLSQMGYFDPEKIQINPIPNQADGTVDIEYTVEEKPSDQIELSGGWGGYIGFVGTLGLVFNNFSLKNIPNRETWKPLPSGDGQKLSVRFQANGKQYQTYSLGFSEPWLGGKKPINFGVSLQRTVYRMTDYSSLYGFGTGGSSRANFRGGYFNNGITVSLGRRLKEPDRNLVMTHSLSYNRYRLDSINIFGGSYNTGVSNNIAFNTTISRNTLSDLQFPRNGSNISLSATFTPPYSAWRKSEYTDASDKYRWVEYHKWMFDASYYATITGKLVLAARTHMGFLGSYGDKAGFSPFGRFIVGGSGLAGQGAFSLADQDIIGLRGYTDQSVGPQLNGRPAGGGGVVYNKYVMELRYPVSLNPQATIFILSFAEGGNNWGSYKEFNPFDLKRSAGVGARIFMPAFGLLGIDWGYGFDKLQGQTKRSGPQFHFTIGQQIR
ncbi:Outer membrane protein assembly factor BamA [Dyadobacter sp. CECT 9275]|uniref:Outer membrane protein assembly factor BamA n=1 Tax=Dyadobacter helix TaxID=2822344 RepID=A0A916N2A5_9BACT|nr:outer membrane protein assembly factor BamA [Dyadobacter sp. CECT 9275]CAG4989266.1 Outer membrane protein assembly factor BamA [Dyadobacter sp. CECT 9275]